MPEVTLERMNTELVNQCAQFLKMVLTAAQAHAAHGGKTRLFDYIGKMDEARLVIHALGNDIEVELLAPANEGDFSVRIFYLPANCAPAWDLH